MFWAFLDLRRVLFRSTLATGAPPGSPQICTPLTADDYKSVQGAAKGFDLGADALYVGAAIFAIAGVYLFFDSHDAIPGIPIFTASLGAAPMRGGGAVQ